MAKKVYPMANAACLGWSGDPPADPLLRDLAEARRQRSWDDARHIRRLLAAQRRQGGRREREAA